jgi:hypothetical protein
LRWFIALASRLRSISHRREYHDEVRRGKVDHKILKSLVRQIQHNKIERQKDQAAAIHEARRVAKLETNNESVARPTNRRSKSKK